MHNSGTVEFRSTLREACPPLPGEQTKSWLYRLARQLGIDAARADSIYYDPRCKVSADEVERINRALSAHITKIRHRADQLHAQQEEISHATRAELQDLLSQALELLNRSDACGNRPHVAVPRNRTNGGRGASTERSASNATA